MSTCCKLIAALALTVLCGCNRESEGNHSTGWGEPVNGLRLRAWADKQVFKTEEPIGIKSCFSNASTAPITFWDSGFWQNTKIDMFDSHGHVVGTTDEGTARRNAFSPGGSRFKNARIHLNPGQIYTIDPVDVGSLFKLQPDAVYFVEFTYEERQPDYWRGKMLSGRVRIQTAGNQ